MSSGVPPGKGPNGNAKPVGSAPSGKLTGSVSATTSTGLPRMIFYVYLFYIF